MDRPSHGAMGWAAARPLSLVTVDRAAALPLWIGARGIARLHVPTQSVVPAPTRVQLYMLLRQNRMYVLTGSYKVTETVLVGRRNGLAPSEMRPAHGSGRVEASEMRPTHQVLFSLHPRSTVSK